MVTSTLDFPQLIHLHSLESGQILPPAKIQHYESVIEQFISFHLNKPADHQVCSIHMK
jgi:hypothetical protein